MSPTSLHIKTSLMISLMVVLSTLTVASSFFLAAKKGYINSEYYFISVAFNRDPARAVASYGLPLMSLSAAVLFVCKYLWLIMQLKHPEQVRFSNYALIAGLISCLALVGAGAVSISTHLVLHLALAGIFFALSLLSMFTFTLLYSFVTHERPSLLVTCVRWSLFAVGVLAAIVLLLFIDEQPHLASLAELVTTSALVGYLVTLNHDLKHFRLQLSLVSDCPLFVTGYLLYVILAGYKYA